MTAKIHHFSLRTYYEDTDAGGIVYHASYLRFAERARTEWLRNLGVNQDDLRQAQSLGFVVTSLAVDYHRPARLDDALQVTTGLVELGRATMKLKQEIWRPDAASGSKLATLTVTIACVELGTKSGTGRVARLPEALYKQLAG